MTDKPLRDKLEKLRQAQAKLDAEEAKIEAIVKEMYRLQYTHCQEADPEVEKLIKGRG